MGQVRAPIVVEARKDEGGLAEGGVLMVRIHSSAIEAITRWLNAPTKHMFLGVVGVMEHQFFVHVMTRFVMCCHVQHVTPARWLLLGHEVLLDNDLGF